MEVKIFKLYFCGPLHISSPSEDYGKSENSYHSDSLYAASIAALSQYHCGLGQVAETGDLGCTISSLFPFTRDENEREIFFFPKPFVPYNAGDLMNIAKKVKKAKWLDSTYYSRVLKNEYLGLLGESKYEKEGGAHIQGTYLTEQKIDEDFLTTFTVPRIRVPRSSTEGDGNTEIFYMERLLFKKNSGLYFIADGDTSLLEKALKLLQYDGIGTDRNVGQGQFKYEKDSLTINVPEKGDRIVSLSLFCPESKDQLKPLIGVDPNSASYEIVNRGGWITSPGLGKIRKRSIYMFSEGSVFQAPDNPINKAPLALGEIGIDLSPWNDLGTDKTPKYETHKIFRSGRSLFLPLVTS